MKYHNSSIQSVRGVEGKENHNTQRRRSPDEFLTDMKALEE